MLGPLRILKKAISSDHEAKLETKLKYDLCETSINSLESYAAPLQMYTAFLGCGDRAVVSVYGFRLFFHQSSQTFLFTEKAKLLNVDRHQTAKSPLTSL